MTALRSLLCAALGMVLLSPVLTAQWLEQYTMRKEAEKTRPNPYLVGETGETKDVLQEYYRRLLAARQGGTSATASGGGAAALSSRLSAGTMLPLDGAVDPAAYVVGPGDVFALMLGGSLEPQPLAVTPEGTLIIPTVGVVAVSGRTLEEARTRVLEAVRTKYRSPELSVSLLAPRSFRVHVVGMTGMPGSYVASAVDRVDQVVALSGALAMAPRQQADSAGYPERGLAGAGDASRGPVVSLRSVQIRRRDGSTLSADLLRWFAGGDARFNPLLRDGDVVVLRPEHADGHSVGIYGAVAMEGTFEYRGDDSLLAAISIAGGLLPDADEGAVEIARMVRADSVMTLTVNLKEIRDGHRSDLALRVNDRIYVRRKNDTERPARVSVFGEVRAPGAYSIPRSGATLSEVIARAGGFTRDASLPAARIVRRHKFADPAYRSPDFRRLDDLRLSGLTNDGREYYTMEAALGQNRVSADFPALFERRHAAADVALEDGDVIYIPQRETNVAVLGQVRRPGYLPHAAGATVKEYIAMAGGASDAADLSDVQVIKYGTGAWMDPDDTDIEAGDKIWVPREKVYEFEYYVALLRDVFTVLATVVTAVALYVSATK